jgi:hypothetical protein
MKNVNMFEFKNWEWNNGQYYKYDVDFNTIIIRKFQTYESRSDFGHLIINNVIIKTGKDLGASNIEEGLILLLNFYDKNY